MKLYAFQGYRYNSARVDAAAQAAPPFDQIDESLRDRLHAQSPHQFARVTKPVGDGGLTAHERSVALHREWIENGVVVRDDTASIYPYAITQPDGSRRLGLCALVGVEPGRERDLWPHEQTVAKSIAERLDLLRLSRIDIEPVFYLAEDDGTLERLLGKDCAGDPGDALVSHVDPWTGDIHSLFRITDSERVGAYAAALTGARAAIADGHHRTQVAQTYAAEEGAASGTAASCKMVVLTSLASANLRIDPVHRGIRVPVDREAMSSLPLRRETLAETRGAAIAARVAAADQPALAVWFRGDAAPELWTLDPAAAPADMPGRKADLPAALLHHHLLRTARVPLEAATDGSIAYEADPDDIIALLERADITAGVFLPPMTPRQFALATEDGDLLPPKSTRFLPKLVSGLVWCGHDAEVVEGGAAARTVRETGMTSRKPEEWPYENTFLVSFNPDEWSQRDRFHQFCQTSCRPDGERKFLGGRRAFESHLGAYWHMDGFRVLMELARGLEPKLADEHLEKETRGYTSARNGQKLRTVVEVAIKEIYSALECTIKVIHTVYENKVDGFRQSVSRFVKKDEVQQSLPPELRLPESDVWRDLVKLRTSLTHWNAGSASMSKDGKRIQYLHSGLEKDGKPFHLEDLFSWLENLDMMFSSYQENVYAFLNRNHIEPGEVQVMCGMYRGLCYTRLVDPADDVTWNSGICEARTWFEQEGNEPCPMRLKCGAYERAVTASRDVPPEDLDASQA